jgi:hypothetical protein
MTGTAVPRRDGRPNALDPICLPIGWGCMAWWCGASSEWETRGHMLRFAKRGH